jgi:glycosyltransferase involved in cell wall biosynthesis
MSLKVSVAMTCFNTSKFVEQAIKSIYDQTYTNWELVIVDDASTDGTLKVVGETISKLVIKQKCRIFKHKENFGYGKTLKDAIEYSNGELVAVVDSDDVIKPTALSLVVPPHEKYPDVCLVYTNYMVCGTNLNNIRIVKNFQIPEKRTFLNFMKGVSHFKCFKKSFYNKTEGIDPTLVKSVDKDLILKLEEVGRFFYVDATVYMYREHRNNLSNSFFRKPKDEQIKIKKSRDKIIENAKLRRRLLNAR